MLQGKIQKIKKENIMAKNRQHQERKTAKQLAAIERNTAWNELTTDQKIKSLKSRRGYSFRQISKLVLLAM